jgi:hypothetical protein
MHSEPVANSGDAAKPAVFLTVRDFREPRALPHTTFYRMVKAGQIKTCKRGKRTLVHVDEARRYDAALLATAA